MVLKLYGAPFSTCTQRVAIVLHEKKVPFEFHSISFQTGEHKSPAYLEKQPFGQVPYIDDDGFILYESRAICKYIVMKYPDQGPKLLPPTSDLKATALFEQAASVEVSNFDAYAYRMCVATVFGPMRGLAPDQQAFQTNLSVLTGKLDAYEVILGKQKYLAGDELTLADLFHLPYGNLLKKAGSDIMSTKGPNFTRWWNELCARESWANLKDGIKSTA